VNAKPKSTPEPSWWCFVGLDANKQYTLGCVREKADCEDLIAGDEYTNSPWCYGQDRAFVFTTTHKRDGRTETEALPTIRSCRMVSTQIAADSDGDVSVSECLAVQ
jgi:hypothetical protein